MAEHPVERISSRSCPTGRERVRDEWLAYIAHVGLEPGVRYTLCPECVGWHRDG